MRNGMILPAALYLLTAAPSLGQFEEVGSCWHTELTGLSSTIGDIGPLWRGWSWGDPTIMLWNGDMTVYRELHYPTEPFGAAYGMGWYMSTELFDTDPSTIEWISHRSYNGETNLMVFREDGTVVYTWPVGSDIGVSAELFAFNAPDGHTYMTIQYGGQNHVFRLPGHLPCPRDCDGTSVGMMDQPSVSAQMNVFPNPSSGQVVLEVFMPGSLNQGLLEISDMAGRTVHTSTIFPGAPRSISVASLAAGTYNCTLRLGDGTPVATRSVVVR